MRINFEHPTNLYRKPAQCLDQGCFARSRLGNGFLWFPVKTSVYISGTKIRFGVDCTQLADAFELHDREFDQICFNFPHCGRKAGVARNRELLAKFFQR